MKVKIKLGNLFTPSTHQISIGEILTIRFLAWEGNDIQEEEDFKAVMDALKNLCDLEFVKVTILVEPVQPKPSQDGLNLEIT